LTTETACIIRDLIEKGMKMTPMAAGETVGFVGLGDQGGPMASRILASGFRLAVWARRPAALEPFLAAGATAAASLAELAAAARVIGICVTGNADTRQVFEGLLPGLRPGKILLVHSTVHPQTCCSLAEQAAEAGAMLLDAPVSGGGAAAQAGTLTVMAGGDEAAFVVCRPVLESYAKLIRRLGDIGAGQRAKLVNNALMAANMAMAHAAMQIADSIGVDRAAMDEILGPSSGGSFAQRFYGSRPQLADFAVPAGLLRKDVRLLEEVAATSGMRAAALSGPALAFLDAVEAARKTTEPGSP
jgi:3-hydroxyisobutyrate dehydrogenase